MGSPYTDSMSITITFLESNLTVSIENFKVPLDPANLLWGVSSKKGKHLYITMYV